MRIGSIKPELMAIREFFSQSVQLRIPSIQRQFVWDAQDVKELVDSIISGYPVGAVIIWEPTSTYPSAPLVGNDRKTGRRYILDGQQRLTALALIHRGWSIPRGTKSITTTPISYVPDNHKLYLSSQRGIDVSLIVNATLGDPTALSEIQRRFPRTYKAAIDEVGAPIVNYQLPFYVLKTGSSSGDAVYEKIAEIFTRVNSAGVKIGNLEMFLSFFAASFSKEQKDKIINMHDRFSDSYELDLEPVVRFLFTRMGLTQNQVTKVQSFKRSIHELQSRFSNERREIAKLLDRGEKCIEICMEMLRQELGAATTQYIPSQSALVPMFDAVMQCGYEGVEAIPAAEKRKMLRWFLVASFNSIYSTSTNKKIEEDLATIRTHSSRFPLEPLLSAMKSRSPHRNTIERDDIQEAFGDVLRGRSGREYLMLLDVLLHRAGATDWEGRPIVSETAAVHHIFPRELLKESGETDEKMINSLGNLTMISPHANSEIGDTSPHEYLSRYGSDVLEKHMIPSNRKLWTVDKYLDFLDARLRLMARQTTALLAELG